MLIDKSYFVGPLTIAQLGEKAVEDDLKNIINRWEPIIMEAALGYDFYQAFLVGLGQETPEQRWLDLLNGVAFFNISQIKKRFAGFAGGQNSISVIASQRKDLTIYAGTTPGFNVGDNQYTDATLKGWEFEVEIFGAGTLDRNTEWSYKTDGGIALTDTGYTLATGERWIIHFTGKKIQAIASTAGPNLISPLAGFIYYEYMKNLHYQNTGIGVVKNTGENSQPGNPAHLMADAFNEAVKQINIFWEFIQVTTQEENNIYPEWNYRQVYGYGMVFGYNYGLFLGEELYAFNYVNDLY